MNFCWLPLICHSIENCHYKFERLFLVGKDTKNYFVAPKSIHKFQILCGLMAKVEIHLKRQLPNKEQLDLAKRKSMTAHSRYYFISDKRNTPILLHKRAFVLEWVSLIVSSQSTLKRFYENSQIFQSCWFLYENHEMNVT